MEQMNLFDIVPESICAEKSDKLKVVKAKFIESSIATWQELFEGYDELYAITFSSGIQFMSNLIDKFNHTEIIFGCENIVSSDVATIMAVQTKLVERIVANKNARHLSELMQEDKLKLYVSRDTKSHEKIFILNALDGRKRVITGSANMSASAFCGYQRENITYFDDEDAYDWYYHRFEDFKDLCSDNVNEKVITSMVTENKDLLNENIDEIPIVKTLEKKKIVVIEETGEDDNVDIIADIKGMENEIKPMLPKNKKEGKLILAADEIHKVKKKYIEHKQIKELREKKLPKLHIDYETKTMTFNGKECNLNPNGKNIKSDINCINNYLTSLVVFYGDVEQSQRDYYSFMNWYFASAFMPYLRYVAQKNNYEVTPFPVVGIIYGESNGGKSTFTKLLSKLMCGMKIPLNSSDDFTSSNIDKLKCSCEGIPINIDDLAKPQYKNHFEKIIKDDQWGLRDRFMNYPSIAITTNKIPAVTADISKRAIVCRIDTKIDKEEGMRNSKRVNESMKHATNSLYCEYIRIMLTRIEQMVEKMKEGNEDYFPDIFEESAKTLMEIYREYCDEIPNFVRKLSYADYFGNKAVGKNAIQKIILAWQNEPNQFMIERKKNKLTYSYPENGRIYELKYIMDELPPALNTKMASKSLIMELDKAEEFFGVEFRKKWFR